MSECRHHMLLCEMGKFLIELVGRTMVNVDTLVWFSLLAHIEPHSTA